jgi:hypothetical protein
LDYAIEKFRGGEGKRSVQERFLHAFLSVSTLGFVGLFF